MSAPWSWSDLITEIKWPDPVPGDRAHGFIDTDEFDPFQRRVMTGQPGEGPPYMPPGFVGTFSCCRACPFGGCTDCPPEKAWRKHWAARRAASNPSSPSWWRRLTARLRAGETNQ